ncbi:MAG: Flagellar protein (FlbD) [Planctomycetes bacterium ADurb.Bin412]|jgi:flagellar protein FlbD|nr:MAG: Flagellar protein (FlbD) [Planctomycetes bacterium ADurb.Bin412]
MIAVTRLNGKKFVVNAENIRYVESTPDTMITMMNGDKVMVQETLETVVQLAIEYSRQIRCFIG